MSYCDSAYADGYFKKRAYASAWDSAAKDKFLETASRLIRMFCSFEDDSGKTVVYDDSDPGTEIPDWLRRATCEQALYLVNLGKDPLQADKKLTLGIVSADGVVFNKDFQADIICRAACRIIESNGGTVAPEATEEGTVSGGWISK